MSDTPEPAPLTEREMNQFVTLAALPTLERALERLRWLEAQFVSLTAQRDEAKRSARRSRLLPTAAALKADLAQRTAERNALAAELAALRAQPVSNADEFAPLLKAWVIEVFSHLGQCQHTPDSWKRDLDEKTQVLLDAIEQAKEAKP